MVELLTTEELALLTPEEATAYQSILELNVALQSPLDLAELMFPETRRWPHLELLNTYLVALSEYRLTAAGACAASDVRWWYIPQGGATPIYVADIHDIPEEVDAYGGETPIGPIVRRLSISMRPRAGKSRLVTEVFPFWLQLQAGGSIDIGVGTYSDTFAWDWGGQARDFAMRFSQDHSWFPAPAGGARSGREIFNLPQGGKIRYTGVGGGITGKTLHVLIGDDFIKNDVEAQSEATRNQSHNFYDRTWKSRKTRDLRSKARFPVPFEVLMATRWHEADVTGHACYDSDTREPRDDWCILNIPALSKGADVDPLQRPVGEAHPNAAGENRADMERLRADDPRGFSALYQGDPSPEGGGLIPNTFGNYWSREERGEVFFLWRQKDPDDPDKPPSVHAVPASDLVRFTACDMAATEKTSADYTVAFACGFSREYERLFILGRYKQKITTDKYVDELVPFIQDHDAGLIIVENVTYGQKFAQDIRALRKQGFRKLRVHDDMPKMADKVARILTSGLPSMTRRMQVLLPKDAPYRDDLVADIGLFPYGEHDDQPDALAFAAWFVNEMPDYRPPKEVKIPTLGEEIDAHADRAARRNLSSRRGGRKDPWSRVASNRRRR